jgi:hypothetical protein
MHDTVEADIEPRRPMANHSLVSASGRTHAKIALVAVAAAAVFVSLVSGSGLNNAAGPHVVVKASPVTTIATSDATQVR